VPIGDRPFSFQLGQHSVVGLVCRVVAIVSDDPLHGEIGGEPILAAALHSELIAATLAGVAAGFAVNRDGNGASTIPLPPSTSGR
jgi:hypothetical protein